MAFRLYLVPDIGTPPYDTMATGRRPKYIYDLRPPGGWYPYGWNPVFLCGVDLTPAQDAAVVANADVFAFPFDLDLTISGGAVNPRRARFEDFLIPGDLVSNGITERQCGRGVGGLFQFMQKLNEDLRARGIGNQAFIDTLAKLNFQWSTIPSDYQDAVLDAAGYFGYDTSFIVPNIQVRAILKNFSDQWGDRPLTFNQFSI